MSCDKERAFFGFYVQELGSDEKYLRFVLHYYLTAYMVKYGVLGAKGYYILEKLHQFAFSGLVCWFW